jgi:hypothetical protein
VALIEENERSLHSIFLKCHHPLVKFKSDIVDQRMDEDCNLDIFEMMIRINELTKKLVKKKLLIFKQHKKDVKDVKCPFHWWEKHEIMFPTIGFFKM